MDASASNSILLCYLYLSGYEEGTPVVYNYSCGKLNGEEVVITVTLNLSVEEDNSSADPGEGDSSIVPDNSDVDSSAAPDNSDEHSSIVPGNEDEDSSAISDQEVSKAEDSEEDAEEISVTDNQEEKEAIPATGDNANVVLLLVGIVVSAVIILGLKRKSIS